MLIDLPEPTPSSKSVVIPHPQMTQRYPLHLSRPNVMSLLRLSLALSFLVLATSTANAQYAITRSVEASGATAATVDPYALQGTVGQVFVGTVSGGQLAINQGYWPGDGTGGPPTADIQITITPLSPPIVVPPGGGNFLFQLTIANNTSVAETIQFWTEISLRMEAASRRLAQRPLRLQRVRRLAPSR